MSREEAARKGGAPEEEVEEEEAEVLDASLGSMTEFITEERKKETNKRKT